MKKKIDLTDGSIGKKLIYLSLPIIATSFMSMAYNLTDMFWVGKIGGGAVAAVGSAGFFINLGYGILSLSEVGTGIAVSQNIGAKKAKIARRFAENGIFFVLFLALIFSLGIFFFSESLIAFFGMGKEISEMAVSYMNITVFGTVLMGVNITFSRIFNSYGNSKIPFRITSIGLVLNMILDPILIFYFDMGVDGAGYATLISTIVVTLIFVKIIRKELNILIKLPTLEFSKIKKILNFSFPSSIQRILFTSIYIVIAKIIADFGEDAIAIQKIGVKIESLSYMIAAGFQGALISFIGQNYGANQKERIRKGYNISLRIMIVIGLLSTSLFFFLPEYLFRIFVKEESIIRGGINYLKILSASQIFMCMEIMTVGAFNGIGKTKLPPINSIIFSALRIPMAWYFGKTMGIEGVWWAISISSIIKGGILPVWFLYVLKKLKIRSV